MIGFSIRKVKRRVNADTVNNFRGVPTANISDCMSRMTAGGARIRPMRSEGIVVGPPFTVKTRPGDNLLVHKALDMALPGDVIVVDAGATSRTPLSGRSCHPTPKRAGSPASS